MMTADEEEVRKILEGRDYPSLDIAFEEAKRVLDNQFGQIDGLDTKASVLVGFSGVLLTLFLTVVPNMIRRYDLVVGIGIVGSFVGVVFSIVFAVIAIRLKIYTNIPSIESLINKYLRWQERHTKYHMLFEVKRAFERNSAMIKSKARWVELSFASLELGILLSTLVLLYQLFSLV